MTRQVEISEVSWGTPEDAEGGFIAHALIEDGGITSYRLQVFDGGKMTLGEEVEGEQHFIHTDSKAIREKFAELTAPIAADKYHPQFWAWELLTRYLNR